MRGLASTVGRSGSGLKAYIVGRNQRSADAIIADCRKMCPTGDFHFVKANDLSLIKDVDRVCQEITTMETLNANSGQACIDLLVLSQAWFAFGGKLKRIGMSCPTILSPFSEVEVLTPSINLNRNVRRPHHVLLASLL